MSCVVGIDIGTTSTIGILLDTKTNKILKKVSLKVDLFSPKIGWAEENPNQWWSNTKKILIKLIQYSKLKKKKKTNVQVFLLQVATWDIYARHIMVRLMQHKF